jgi:hypothetical protein
LEGELFDFAGVVLAVVSRYLFASIFRAPTPHEEFRRLITLLRRNPIVLL